MNETWLVTGAAGFIGFHACKHLLADGATVVGLDSLTPYYDVALKRSRVTELARHADFAFEEVDVCDEDELERVFATHDPTRVVHLAAQPGVRQSVDAPMWSVRSNVVGFASLLEGSRRHAVEHVTYASSSSVYGANSRLPFSVHDSAEHPVSLYGATKRANELMAHAYGHVHGLATTGVRFFTVYGPWGRPDMAYYAFARSIAVREPIVVFGDGSALRDFTYVGDAVEALLRLARQPPEPNPQWDPHAPDPATSYVPFRVCNIGHGEKVSVNRLIALLEQELGQPAERITKPVANSDLRATHADPDDLEDVIGFLPVTPIEEGLVHFTRWFRDYHG